MSDTPVVTELLKKHKVTVPAVNINRIIEENGIELVFEDMDDSDSGLLLIKSGKATIAVNVTHHPNRQRLQPRMSVVIFFFTARAMSNYLSIKPFSETQ